MFLEVIYCIIYIFIYMIGFLKKKYKLVFFKCDYIVWLKLGLFYCCFFFLICLFIFFLFGLGIILFVVFLSLFLIFDYYFY